MTIQCCDQRWIGHSSSKDEHLFNTCTIKVQNTSSTISFAGYCLHSILSWVGQWSFLQASLFNVTVLTTRRVTVKTGLNTDAQRGTNITRVWWLLFTFLFRHIILKGTSYTGLSSTDTCSRGQLNLASSAWLVIFLLSNSLFYFLKLQLGDTS